jgi:tetratricopeptide (TPR) repeat protein
VLDRAIKLAPDDPGVALQQARLELARNRPAAMMTLANRALAVGQSDLDVAIAYASHARHEAGQMEASARKLRSGGHFIDTRLHNGAWTKTYVGPTADDYARADELERTAREWRTNAAHALDVLQTQLAGRTDSASRVTLHIAEAFRRVGTRDATGAIESAERALALDPTNGYALRLLSEAYGRTGSPKARAIKAALDEVNRYE